MKKGDRVVWRGGLYRITHAYSVEYRIESIAYPGVFHIVGKSRVKPA